MLYSPTHIDPSLYTQKLIYWRSETRKTLSLITKFVYTITLWLPQLNLYSYLNYLEQPRITFINYRWRIESSKTGLPQDPIPPRELFPECSLSYWELFPKPCNPTDTRPSSITICDVIVYVFLSTWPTVERLPQQDMEVITNNPVGRHPSNYEQSTEKSEEQIEDPAKKGTRTMK
jgi:hypothetical protein